MALEATSALGVAAGSKAAGLAALAATPGRSVGVQIAAGSYERLLFGLDLVHDSEAGYGLKPLFIYAPHTGCIKALASGDRFLASGSTDEVIRYSESGCGCANKAGRAGARTRKAGWVWAHGRQAGWGARTEGRQDGGARKAGRTAARTEGRTAALLPSMHALSPSSPAPTPSPPAPAPAPPPPQPCKPLQVLAP